MNARFITRALALLTLVVAFGCQAIVSSDPPSFVCSGTSLAACPAGNYCKGAGCSPCEAIDICDGFDNDCNGKVDDGDKNDRDKDGVTICGRISPTGEVVDRDCDDDDSSVNPLLPEVCNGKDDDCDGQIDENACAEDELCAPKTGCVKKATACDPTAAPPACPVNQRCDTATLSCVGNAVLPLGTPCVVDQQCGDSAFCAPSSLLPSGIGAVCTRSCCSSADCPNDFVCAPQGTGGNFCVSARALGRSAIGTATGGSACTANADCRSGVCDAKRCEEPCCDDSTCATGTVCRATSFVGSTHFTFGCAVKNGSRVPFSDCSAGNCEKGACSDFVEGSVCVSPCCGSVGCGTLDGDSVMCREVAPRSHAGDRVFACSLIVAGTSFLPMGETCTKASECRGNLCQSDQKTGTSYCSDICCRDSDCTGGLSCLPYASSGVQVLRCQRT